MAHATLTADTGFLSRLIAPVTAVFQVMGSALMANASAEARLREVARLRALPDAELAKLGLTRDTIVQHVFRDIYMI